MRNLLLLLVLLFWAEGLFPQKKYSKRKIRKHQINVYTSKIKGTVILSLDTIFKKGTPYAILRKKKQLPYNYFELFSLNNKKLILIQTRICINSNKTPYYAFNFIESDNVAEPEKYYGFNITKVVVENELVQNNKIDPYSETLFLMKYPGKFSDTTIKTYITDKPDESKINTANIYETVVRNRETAFYFKEGKIMQDYKMIGRYKMMEATVRFYLPNGIQVAEANENENKANSWNVWSLKDSRNMIVQSDQSNYLRELIGFLLKYSYL